MRRIVLPLLITLLIFSFEVNAQRKGLVFDKSAYESIPKADDESLGYTDETLPTVVNHKKYAPYAGDQGDFGTCVGWSASYGALTIEYAKKMNLTDRQQITFSAFCPYYIYNQFKDDYDFFCQSGGLFEDALDIMYTTGSKRYYLPEYTCYSDYKDFSTNNAKNFKINNYYRLFDWSQSETQKTLGLDGERTTNIKKALAKGHPVLWGAYVTPSFDYLGTKELWTPTTEEKNNYNTHPGHAMVIVGYDDNKYGGAFEIMNSWGTNWGNQGFFWVKYEDADLFGHTAFYMDLGYKYYASSGCQMNDCTDGYGRYKWPTGEVYEGELSNGYFDGTGLYIWKDGNAYAGEWKDGFKHGKGTQLYASGGTTVGYWKDNAYVGSTEPDWTETTTVVTPEVEPEVVEEEDVVEEVTPTTGCISGNCENGFGKFIYSDGDIYEGNFKSSYRHGHGKYTYIEGDYYDGMWSWSSREGLGYYKWPSGNEYIGYWKNNQQNGKGTKYFTNGNTEAGEWVKGVFQSKDEATFGYSASGEKTQDGHSQAGTIFNRVEHGEELKPQHNQIKLKQNGFNAIPKSGLGAPMPDPYYNFTRDVMDQLIQSIGKTDITNPKVNIINSNTDVAYTNKKTGIHVSTKFIDLCRSFGKDSASAMSVVLAHELGHYYKDHFFCRDFGYAYSETQWADQMSENFKTIHETGYYETQADEFGLFFSFISGYDPFKVAEKVIEKVYQNFSLPDEMTGYPPKDFRIEQISLAAENVKKLIPVFEVANLMTVLSSGKGNSIQNDLIEQAKLCYEHIIDQKITTPEMYNNLGVNYVNKAMALLSEKDFPYALPLQIDFTSRLYSLTGSGGTKGDLGYSENERAIKENLAQARNYFEAALKMDEEYVPGYNNLSAVFILLKDYEEARAKARKARKLGRDYKAGIPYRNSIDLLAVISFLDDELDDAIDYWEEAHELESSYSKNNIGKAGLESEFAKIDFSKPKNKGGETDIASVELPANSPYVKFKRPDFKEIEKVNGKTLNDIAQDYLYNNKAMETWQLKDNKAMMGKDQYEDGELLIYASIDRGSLGDSYYFYFYPSEGEKATSLDIKNGDHIKMLRTAYKEPANIIASATHEYWVYFNKNVIFKVDENRRVDGYIIYDVNL